MPTTAPITGNAMARAIKGEFRQQWRNRFTNVQNQLTPAMRLGINSTNFEELYGFWDSPGGFTRREWGEPRKFNEPMQATTFAVENVPFSAAVQWFRHQRLFDNIGNLTDMARQAGTKLARLPWEAFFDILTGTATVLETIPKAADGLDLFDSSTRFGDASGNVLTGAGVAAADTVLKDAFNLIERILSFQEPNGSQIYTGGEADQGVTIYFGMSNRKVFAEAFQQKRSFVEGAVGGAAVTSLTEDLGMPIRLIPSARITDNDYFIFLDAVEDKPVAEQVHTPLDEWDETHDNSDKSRRDDTEGVFWETIRSYFVGLPIGAGKVDNA